MLTYSFDKRGGQSLYEYLYNCMKTVFYPQMKSCHPNVHLQAITASALSRLKTHMDS